ncbi:glycosyltransferase family 4 protein [Sulfitobacter sp.]|uniref:glycosyltransferase family 4 protein n=1 Tax=Sulfitobacter sp. TaxID=1903071 RepID=UPI003566D0CE
MRVVQVINHFGTVFGGAERLTTTLHCDLIESGVDAHLISIGVCEIANASQTTSLGFETVRDPRVLLRLRAVLRDLVRPGTVVHAHLFPATLHVSALRQTGQLATPCSMTEHSTWNRRREHVALRGLDRIVYRGFERIAAISTQTQDALLSAYPVLRPRTEIIRNGATLRFATPPEHNSDQIPCILTVARLAPVKNIANALRALAKLTDRPWRYVVAGGGEDEGKLKSLAAELGIAKRVTFLGQVSDITPLLAAAHIFLLPSRWEGFGLAAVEAMNAALPVVATDVPGLREVVVPAGNPIVAPDDVDGMASAIAALLDDPARRARLGAAGFEQAWQYDRKGMNEGYMALWSDLLAGRAVE